MTKITTAKKMISLTDNHTASVVPFMIAQGIAASTVATGQRRQKYSGNDVVKKYGTATTKLTKTPYLMNRVQDGIVNLT